MISMNIYFLVVIFLCSTLVSSQDDKTIENEGTQGAVAGTRENKFFSLFNLVRFSNNMCNGTSELSGYCLTSFECEVKGGTVAGTCALGFGVCCEVIYTCGDSSYNKVSYFQNPDYPNAVSQSQIGCSYSVIVNDEDCCQIRIDFETFEMEWPDTTTGDCSLSNDLFSVYGDGIATTGIPMMCGENTGQHMYVHLDTTAMPVTVQLIAVTNAVDPGRWRIKVTVINCNTRNLLDRYLEAPNACTQYYPDPSGTIESIGYTASGSRTYPLYPNNLEYSICIKRPINAQCIEYTLNEVSMNDGLNCFDYILIPYDGSGPDPRICTVMNTLPITNSAAGWPYVLFVYTDTDPSNIDAFGFSITYNIYSDSSCTSAITT